MLCFCPCIIYVSGCTWKDCSRKSMGIFQPPIIYVLQLLECWFGCYKKNWFMTSVNRTSSSMFTTSLLYPFTTYNHVCNIFPCSQLSSMFTVFHSNLPCSKQTTMFTKVYHNLNSLSSSQHLSMFRTFFDNNLQ